MIDVDYEGEFYVIARGSGCGTLVGSRAIGGGRGGGQAPLRDRDTITIGTKASPFVFQFFVTDWSAVQRRPSVNTSVVKPAEVVRQLQTLVPFHVSANVHVRAWRHYKVRPTATASEPDRTNPKFCIYDQAHTDYLYTPAWIQFLARKLSNAETYEIITGSALGRRERRSRGRLARTARVTVGLEADVFSPTHRSRHHMARRSIRPRRSTSRMG